MNLKYLQNVEIYTRNAYEAAKRGSVEDVEHWMQKAFAEIEKQSVLPNIPSRLAFRQRKSNKH